MSWRERDYTWFSESSGAMMRDWRTALPPAGTIALVIVHLIGFIVALILRNGFSQHAAESIALTNDVRAWAILTHPIATSNGLMLSCVLFGVWSLAGRIEGQFGVGRMLTLYVAGNTLAALAFVALASFQPVQASAMLSEPIGAIAAFVVTIWRLMPLETIPLFGRFFSVRNVALWVFGSVVVLTVMQYGPGSTAWLAAMLAGAAVAPVIEAAAVMVARRRKRPRMEAASTIRLTRRAQSPRHSESSATDEPSVTEIDDLLAKISRSGLDSLTAEDRARLEAARLARLERGPT